MLVDSIISSGNLFQSSIILCKKILPAVQVAELFIKFITIGPCDSVVKAKRVVKG